MSSEIANPGNGVRREESLAAAVFLAPNVLGFVVFSLLPVLAAFALSFCRWDLFHPARFVAFQNYVDLLGWERTAEGSIRFNDPHFWKYLGNTLFLMLSIPLTMLGSLLLAIVLNQQLIGRSLLRAVFFLPTICSGVGLLLLWKYLLNAEFGLINVGLRAALGVDGPNWLGEAQWAKPAMILMSVWGGIGGTSMIIYLAGLQQIPQQLYEAAEIDGAGPFQRFRSITLPMLAPTTFFILITSVIGAFQGGFSMAYVMTHGGPEGSTTTVDYHIYNHAFQFFHMGYAAAISVVLFFLIFLVTLLQWRWGRSAASYE